MKNKIYRLQQISTAFIGFYWRAFVLTKGNITSAKKKRAVLLKQTLEKLGSVFIKFGQLLALRPDVLSQEYCHELFFLLENVPPFSYEEVQRIFQEDFQQQPEELFASFSKQPLAAASFGQVHKAKLKSGENVAVKIQRPNIVIIVTKDITLMKSLARIIDFFIPKSNKLLPLIEEFEQWTQEELDYTVEAKNTEEYYNDIRDNPETIAAPKIYKTYCSKRILTTEFIEGLTLSKILFAYKQNDRTILKQLKEMGFKRKTVAEKILNESLKQMYLKGIFHADPHPANVIFTPSGRLVYIDFGIFGYHDKKRRMMHMRYARALMSQDIETSFTTLLQLCDVSEVKDLIGFKNEHAKLIASVPEIFKQGHQKDTPQILGIVLFQTLHILQKYHAKVPTTTLRHFRNLVTRESLILHVYPEMTLEELAHAWRDISIINLIEELPNFLTKNHMKKYFIQWMNLVEEDIIKDL